MDSKKQITVLLSAQIALLICLCIYGAFIGTAKAAALFSSPPIITLWILLLLSLTAASVIQILNQKIAVAAALFGIFLIVLAGIIGSEKFSQTFYPNRIYSGYMLIYEGGKENRVILNENETKELPFEIKLDSFKIDFYQDSQMPKRFASSVKVIDNDKTAKEFTIEVNKPLVYQGYSFYQSSYKQYPQKAAVLSVKSNNGSRVMYCGFAVLTGSLVYLLLLPNLSIILRSKKQ